MTTALFRVAPLVRASALALLFAGAAGWLSAAEPGKAVPAAANDAAFDYFENNWNVVGLKDYLHGSRVTPNNELWVGGRTADPGPHGPRPGAARRGGTANGPWTAGCRSC